MNSFIFVPKLNAEVYEFGGKSGWNEISVKNGITTGKGRFGYESLELKTNYATAGEFTDCLLDFENGEIIDRSGKYEIKENGTYSSKKSIMGKGSVLSRNRKGITLLGNTSSLFGGKGPAGSFSIDFWICPSVVENGEVLLNWRSSKNNDGQILYQVVSISFYKNKTAILFSNIFEGYTKNKGDVTLFSERSIIPEKWSHHLISFEEDSGILEYRIDGQLEDIKFITDTEHEGGTVYNAVMGVGADLHLVPRYTGLLDDFCIIRTYGDLKQEEKISNSKIALPDRYSTSGGRFESNPILTKQGTLIKSVSAVVSEPSQTEVKLYVRAGDSYFNWTEDFPEWKCVKNGEEIENLRGLYFQIAADLLPDGSGQQTPSVSQINVEYEVLPEPFPPYRISSEKGDGEVTLKWTSSVDDSAGGYYIYYGNRPGEYLGRIALQGKSPIDVGNVTEVTLTGLKNGTIYYFAVATYSKYDKRVSGPLSKEVFARPERMLKK